MAPSLADSLLDASVVRSFDRSGFLRHARAFDPADLDVDLSGRVAVVTGANSGIGLAVTRGLAARGARVWMACRSAERSEAARAALRAENPGADLRLAILDVASLASVEAFVASFDEARLDVLVHNAGVLPDRRMESPDGLELTWATMVVGPFALTARLLPRLTAAPEGRTIGVASGGGLLVRLDVDGRTWRDRPFDGVRAYAAAKRAQIALVERWAGRLAGTRVTVHAMHPGWADTPAVRSSLPRFHRWTRGILRTPDQGADTVLWLAAVPRLVPPTGGFWFDRRPASPHPLPWTREPPGEVDRLWDVVTAEARVGDLLGPA